MLERLDVDYAYHPPFGDQVQRYQQIREAAKAFAKLIADLTPESREQSLALTDVETAVMRANAAIARYEIEGCKIVGYERGRPVYAPA